MYIKSDLTVNMSNDTNGAIGVDDLWLELQRKETNGEIAGYATGPLPSDKKETDRLSQLKTAVRQDDIIVMGDRWHCSLF